jgi:hypothetical protein
MGRQVGFFLDECDYQNLLDFVEQAGFMALPELVSTGMRPSAVKPTEYKLTEQTGRYFFYLLPKGFTLDDVTYGPCTDILDLSKLVADESPVIELTPCQRAGDRLKRGRIYFCLPVHDPRYDAALKAYNLVQRHMRKWKKVDRYKVHLGPHTVEACTGEVHFFEIETRLPTTVSKERRKRPVTARTLAGLEKAFGLSLPKGYVRFVCRYPDDLLHTKTDLGWKQESPAERQLVNDVAKLQKLNALVRLPGTPWTEDDGPWPEHCFVIGDDECGNYWALDTREADSPVYFYDHDYGTFTRQHGSVEEFGRWLVQHIREWNQKQKK